MDGEGLDDPAAIRTNLDARAEGPQQRMSSMLYRALVESVDVLSVSLAVQFKVGGENIACSISREALCDLGYHHGIRGTEQELVSALAHEIERLSKAKLRAGRIEENNELVIRYLDLLRYGFDSTTFDVGGMAASVHSGGANP
jgi:hypothetical protein